MRATEIALSRDCVNPVRNLEISTQFRDSKNVQRNLEIAQIPRLRGTYTKNLFVLPSDTKSAITFEWIELVVT